MYEKYLVGCFSSEEQGGVVGPLNKKMKIYGMSLSFSFYIIEIAVAFCLLSSYILYVLCCVSCQKNVFFSSGRSYGLR